MILMKWQGINKKSIKIFSINGTYLRHAIGKQAHK